MLVVLLLMALRLFVAEVVTVVSGMKAVPTPPPPAFAPGMIEVVVRCCVVDVVDAAVLDWVIPGNGKRKNGLPAIVCTSAEQRGSNLQYHGGA
jgi:hypothetical protein